MLSKYEWAAHAAMIEAEEAYERKYSCKAHGCDAAVEDTKQCDDCGEYFCDAHLTVDPSAAHRPDGCYVYCAACVEREAAEFAAWRSMNGALTGERRAA